MRSNHVIGLRLGVMMALLLSALTWARARAASDAQTGITINLSHDLVRLGIASENLAPDSPTADARPLFQAAIAYAQSHPVGLITVDHGAYYFLTPQTPQIYLLVSELSNLTVDLAFSTIHFAQPLLRSFELSNCTNVTLTRFTTEFLNPPFTHVRLTAVDPLRRSLSYTALPGWPDPVTFNALTPPDPTTGPLELWAMVFRKGDIVPATSRIHVSEPIAAGVLDLVQDNTPWTQSATLATLNPGDIVVVTVRGGFGPVTVVSSDHVTISDATVHGSSAIAVLFISSSHSLADRVRVTPGQHAGGSDLISSNADGIHFSSTGPDNHISRSFVTRTMDDALAIDSRNLATVVSQAGPRQLTVERTAFLRFPNGTAVTFVDPVTSVESSSAIIVAQTPADTTPPVFNGPVTLTFDRDLPTLAAGAGMAVADAAARGAGSTIEDNVVANVPFGRGVWIGGAQGVTIARNRIGHTSNGGVAVTDSTINFPTPPAHDIGIRDNVVRGSLGPAASGSGTQIAVGAIMVAPTNNKGQFAATPDTNISIERNLVVNSGRSGIWVDGIDGGSISDNIIDGWDRHPELPFFGVNAQTQTQLLQDFKQPLVVHNSQAVQTNGNVMRQSSGATSEEDVSSAQP
jgi:Right handed beta helix region